jgi:hypothetical protein
MIKPTVGECDCCGKRRKLTQCWVGELETWACYRCQSVDPADYGEDDMGEPLPDDCPYSEAEIARSQDRLRAILGPDADDGIEF